MSRLEDQLALQIRAAKLPEPMREYVGIPGRRFRFDFAWPEKALPYRLPDDPSPAPLAVEVQGGIFTRNRTGHSSGSGLLRDYEKNNLAVLAGWRVLYVAAPHIRSGEALAWIKEALGE